MPERAVDMQEERISARDFSRLRELVYEEAGINLSSEKRSMLEGRIRRRLKSLAIPSYEQYCKYLFSRSGRKQEICHLIDVVTTNKTDFFREPRHFEFLVNTALPELSQHNRSLFFWSAGCSTGEEPYTLAMVVREYAEIHPGLEFRILATDVCSTVLEKASQAVYSCEAVQPVPAALKLKYLMRSRDPSVNRVRVVPELRRLIEFRRLNFMDRDYGVTEKASAIFCRNVLIYFDRITQQRILEQLTRYLVPDGYLFVGHSETLHELNLPLQQIAPALYRRTHD